ncbi:thiamine ABC transporter permease [Photobacterium damselae]|nr:thiamine ABC transporter permease [Photobacterium damselae]
MRRSLFILTIIIVFLPIIPGLFGVILPAFSYIPTLGLHHISLQGFFQVFQWPHVTDSIVITVWSGLISTAISLYLTYSFLRLFWHTDQWKKLEAWLSPLLAIPHVAFAIGLMFLVSPTGWLNRLLDLISSKLAIINLAQDPYALGLILVLTIKETPFLILMSIAVLQQLNTPQLVRISASLGYSPQQTWQKVIFPQWLPKIRLPLYAVIAYGLSVVDLNLIIGPSQPSSFSVLVWQWFNDSDLTLLPRATAGALVLLLIAGIILCVVRSLEWIILHHRRHWLIKGTNSKSTNSDYPPANGWFVSTAPLRKASLLIFLSLPIVTLPLLGIWSFALRWRFPDILPSRWSEHFWQQEIDQITQLLTTSTLFAVLSALICLILVIGSLEFRDKYQLNIPVVIIAIPLVVPQLSLLFGIQITTLYFPTNSYFLWVLWGHIFYVFPYMYLALDGTWRSYDPRYSYTAASLGISPVRVWWQVKRPQLMTGIIFAFAMGLSVSFAQYLPTQMLGAGRITTLTTEAVTLASGQDRRVTAIYGLLQGLLPLVSFTLALIFSKKYRINS